MQHNLSPPQTRLCPATHTHRVRHPTCIWPIQRAHSSLSDQKATRTATGACEINEHRPSRRAPSLAPPYSRLNVRCSAGAVRRCEINEHSRARRGDYHSTLNSGDMGATARGVGTEHTMLVFSHEPGSDFPFVYVVPVVPKSVWSARPSIIFARRHLLPWGSTWRLGRLACETIAWRVSW